MIHSAKNLPNYKRYDNGYQTCKQYGEHKKIVPGPVIAQWGRVIVTLYTVDLLCLSQYGTRR
jgi:hypothetical protein